MNQPTTPQPQATPSREPELPEILTWSTSQRLARLSELRLKMDQTGDISAEECRLATRLLTAERISRAGSKGGSKEKAAAAPQSFKQMNLEDL